ncbi:hypothetical protein GCM10023178_09280 [Actinomadura luteofluorescens]
MSRSKENVTRITMTAMEPPAPGPGRRVPRAPVTAAPRRLDLPVGVSRRPGDLRSAACPADPMESDGRRRLPAAS